MTGKTHYKLGILYYIIFSILPLAVSVPIIRGNAEISLASIGAAALGALIADSDTEKSLINRANPVTRGTAKIANATQRIMKMILKLIIGVAAGSLILFNRTQIADFFGNNKRTNIIICLVAFICIFSGAANEKVIKRIPVLSLIYRMCSEISRATLNMVKRFSIITIYFSIGIGLVIYNLNSGNRIIIYVAAVILFGTAIFPHRAFLHSIEGFILYTFLAVNIAEAFAHPQLGNAFVIGYFSHLYLADILTNSGVPVSVVPRILKKTFIHTKLKKFAPYKLFIKVLDSKISASVMSTGTPAGNVFELVYCMVLLIIVLALIANNYYSLTFAII